MAQDPDAMQQRLHDLRLEGQQLAGGLEQAAAQLEETGHAPGGSLVGQLQSYRARFVELLTQLRSGESTSDADVVLDLATIELELARREQSVHACQVARDILSITTRDGVSLPELESVQSDACLLLASHGRECSNEQLEAFRIGHHPWSALSRFIRERDSLSDAEWSSLSRTIEAFLGPGLAIAATRGRLLLARRASDQTDGPPQESCDILPLPQRRADAPIEPMDESAPATILMRAVSSSPEELGSTLGEFESSVIVNPRYSPTETIETPENMERSEIEPALEKVLADTPVSEIVQVTPEPQSDSVFDDIEPVSLTTRHQAPPSPAASRKEAISDEPVVISSEPRTTANVWKPAVPAVSDSSSIFDEPDEDDLIRRKTRTPRNTLVPTPSTVSETISPLARQLLEQASFEEAVSSSASLATRIFNESEAERLTLLPDLILHLIHEGRPGLAYHLAKGLESRTLSEQRFIPSWLIRTWTFGHALLFPRGQLAGLIQEDLQAFPRSTAPQDPDWSLAMSLMIRAATLRPAIVAPGSRAAAVLRSFDLQENCVQLYNYCSRVGAYGERIQGVYPGLFKQTRESVPYAEQLSSLRADMARWSTQEDVVSLKYEPASPLFQKTHWSLRAASSQRHSEVIREWMGWQIALRRGESLIQPVLEDRRSELNRLRNEVEELSLKLSGDEINGLFSHASVRAYLRQALTFAQRWINLHSGPVSSESQTYLPQAAVELQSEIENRHDGVIQELGALAEKSDSFEVRMAVACLLLSVQEIRDLVDPLTVTETREPDPRHLLHSELLKIPELKLGTNWEPIDDPHTVEEEILKFLCQPQPDWVAAFKMQLIQGNDVAAERILSMAIWSPEEYDALEEVLRLDRARQKSEFLKQMAEVRQLLSDSVQLDVLPESDRTQIESRLARLQQTSGAEPGVASGILELGRVRDSLLKRREREAERIRSRLRQLHNTPESEGIPPSVSQPPKNWIMDFDP